VLPYRNYVSASDVNETWRRISLLSCLSSFHPVQLPIQWSNS
jgi:hypothetical protein